MGPIALTNFLFAKKLYFTSVRQRNRLKMWAHIKICGAHRFSHRFLKRTDTKSGAQHLVFSIGSCEKPTLKGFWCQFFIWPMLKALKKKASSPLPLPTLSTLSALVDLFLSPSRRIDLPRCPLQPWKTPSAPTVGQIFLLCRALYLFSLLPLLQSCSLPSSPPSPPGSPPSSPPSSPGSPPSSILCRWVLHRSLSDNERVTSAWTCHRPPKSTSRSPAAAPPLLSGYARL